MNFETQFNHLPLEIQLQIFNYFSPKELFIVEKVSKHFQILASHPIVWKQYYDPNYLNAHREVCTKKNYVKIKFSELAKYITPFNLYIKPHYKGESDGANYRRLFFELLDVYEKRRLDELFHVIPPRIIQEEHQKALQHSISKQLEKETALEIFLPFSTKNLEILESVVMQHPIPIDLSIKCTNNQYDNHQDALNCLIKLIKAKKIASLCISFGILNQNDIHNLKSFFSQTLEYEEEILFFD